MLECRVSVEFAFRIPLALLQRPGLILHLTGSTRLKKEAPRPPCPIEKLNDDVILYIMKLATPWDWNHEDENDLMGDIKLYFHETMSHVCRRWRNIALDAPSLWKDIDFSDKPPFEWTKEYIRRAKNVPLSITLRHETTYASWYCITLGPRRIELTEIPLILDIILPHVARWGSFQLISYDPRVINDTLTALDTAGEAKELTALTLHFYIDDQQALTIRDHKEDMHSRYVPFGGVAPKLKRLELSRVNVDWSGCKFMWESRLSTLQLSYHAERHRPSYEEFKHVLSAAQNLEELLIIQSGPRIEGSESWPTEVAEMPSLRSAWFGARRENDIVEVIRRLSLPKLKDLTVHGSLNTNSSPTIEALESAFRLQQLDSLTLNYINVYNQTVNDRLWRSLENVTKLRIDRLLHFCEDLDDLKELWEDASVLPRMHTLTVTGGKCQTVLELVQARTRAGKPVKKLSLHDKTVILCASSATLSALRNLVEYYTFHSNPPLIDHQCW